jgi:DNA-binding response OmpR family regulator
LHILIIEDTQEIASNIFDFLEPKGYVLDWAHTGTSGYDLASKNDYDVIVLDLMLPGMDGIEVCKRLRAEAHKTTPIIMLTARDTLEDKVTGFDVGADDYLVKPFALQELEIRIQALSRRAKPKEKNQLITIADLEYDPQTHIAKRNSKQLNLTATTIKILDLLMRESHRVVKREEIERTLWGDNPPDSDALRTHMHSLRTMLDKDADKPLLKTIRGIGYRIVDENDNPS